MLLQTATSSRVSILRTFIPGPRKKTRLTMFSQNPFAAAWYVSSSPWHPLPVPVERRLGGSGNQASSLEVSGKLEPGTPLEKSGQECCKEVEASHTRLRLWTMETELLLGGQECGGYCHTGEQETSSPFTKRAELMNRGRHPTTSGQLAL